MPLQARNTSKTLKSLNQSASTLAIWAKIKRGRHKMFDTAISKLNEMCRCLENLELATEQVEAAIKAAHQNFQELQPHLFEPSVN